MIYVASPYSHPDPSIQEDNHNTVVSYIVKMMEEEPAIVRYSPIMYWHTSAVKYKMRTDAAFFASHNFEVIKLCETLEVLKFGNWKQAEGVLWELDMAIHLRKRIKYVTL